MDIQELLVRQSEILRQLKENLSDEDYALVVDLTEISEEIGECE